MIQDFVYDFRKSPNEYVMRAVRRERNQPQQPFVVIFSNSTNTFVIPRVDDRRRDAVVHVGKCFQCVLSGQNRNLIFHENFKTIRVLSSWVGSSATKSFKALRIWACI